MIKGTILSILFAFALLLPAIANDSIYVQLKDGTILAYEYAENDTVSVDEKFMSIADTTIFSGEVSRVTFDREMLKKESGVRFINLKLRGTDEANSALFKKTFTADVNHLETADTILFNIPYLTSYKLTPYFFTNSQKTKVYANGTEIFSTESIVDFSQPVTMKLEYPDGSTREYVVIVKNSGLPIVVINTPNNGSITSKETWVEKSSMIIYQADGTINYDSGTDYMNIRGRGNSTWSYSKKPYNIKLNTKKAILGMPKHKRWCLLANYIDRTLMRNAVAF